MRVIWSYHTQIRREVTNVIKKLEGIFGNIMATRSKKHDNWGMDLDFTDGGKFKVGMVDYLKWVIESFLE